MSDIFDEMKQLARLQEKCRVNSIESHNKEMVAEKQLEKLVIDNQNLPEQDECNHGMYSTVGSTSDVCSFCFWIDRNPCCY